MALSIAPQLKEEGNTFFLQKDFVCAYDKYTEAIAIDGRNAVLYANRSACSFGMGKFVAALRDARQATEIDPGYAKGWSRLATAHEAVMEFTSAVKAWEKALDALPNENISLAELKQKEQYTTSQQNVKQRLGAVSPRFFSEIATNMHTGKPPWQVAEEMLPELQAAGLSSFHSSAYVIHYANKEFTQGVEYMKAVKRVPMKEAPTGFAIVGHTDGLTYITNGIMRDLRVLRIDCRDWFEKYNDQISFEAEKSRSWTSENVDDIKRSALERLKKHGWNDVRPALSVVVRGWTMRAILDSKVRQAPHVAVERFEEILELLHWGRQVWRNVSKDDRGVIFEDVFVTGIKGMYVQALVSTHVKATGDDQKTLLSALLEASHELIDDIQKIPDPTESVDPGFVSSFQIYPIAEALATTGYCFVQMARSTDNPADKRANYLLAAKQYTVASQLLPQDDEKYCWYLHCAINPLIRAGAPKEVMVNVVELIRASIPKMQRIWAHSSLAKQGRDAMIETTLRVAESCMESR